MPEPAIPGIFPANLCVSSMHRKQFLYSNSLARPNLPSFPEALCDHKGWLLHLILEIPIAPTQFPISLTVPSSPRTPNAEYVPETPLSYQASLHPRKQAHHQADSQEQCTQLSDRLFITPVHT